MDITKTQEHSRSAAVSAPKTLSYREKLANSVQQTLKRSLTESALSRLSLHSQSKIQRKDSFEDPELKSLYLEDNDQEMVIVKTPSEQKESRSGSSKMDYTGFATPPPSHTDELADPTVTIKKQVPLNLGSSQEVQTYPFPNFEDKQSISYRLSPKDDDAKSSKLHRAYGCSRLHEISPTTTCGSLFGKLKG